MMPIFGILSFSKLGILLRNNNFSSVSQVLNKETFLFTNICKFSFEHGNYFKSSVFFKSKLLSSIQSKNKTFVKSSVLSTNLSTNIHTTTSNFNDYKYFEALDKRITKNEGTFKKLKKRPSKMFGKPQIKGVVLRILIRKPRKPNSANRKCCKVRLSNGKMITAHIPGEGHSLQEHNVVLIEGGKTQDLFAVHHKVIRGKHDCGHVVKPEH